MPAFAATLVEGEAVVLRFPYDDRLRLLIEAIPGLITSEPYSLFTKCGARDKAA